MKQLKKELWSLKEKGVIVDRQDLNDIKEIENLELLAEIRAMPKNLDRLKV